MSVRQLMSNITFKEDLRWENLDHLVCVAKCVNCRVVQSLGWELLHYGVFP